MESLESLQEKLLRDVAVERAYQDLKHGAQNHDDGRWMLVLAEEVGEVGEVALLVHGAQEKEVRELERELAHELVQVAAVALAWAEAVLDGRDRW